MPEESRRRPPAELARLIDDAITAARICGDPWPALERAHIAAQPWAWPHTRVHVAMLRLAWRERDRREITGQLIRIAVAGPGSLANRYPPGNTGRATMGLTEQGPVPDDLADLLHGTT
jgi:hypothetical protein